MDYTIGTLFDYVATKIIIKYFNCYFKNHIHIIKSKSEHWKNKMNLTKWNIGELGVIFFFNDLFLELFRDRYGKV